MSDFNIVIFTIITAIGLGAALFEIMTLWLNKTSVKSVEFAGPPQIQRNLSETSPSTFEGPLMMVSVFSTGSLPFVSGSIPFLTGSRAVNLSISKVSVIDFSDTAELEAFISRHLLVYGGAATVLGLLMGYSIGGFGGALLGGVIGTTLGVGLGTAIAAIKHSKKQK